MASNDMVGKLRSLRCTDGHKLTTGNWLTRACPPQLLNTSVHVATLVCRKLNTRDSWIFLRDHFSRKEKKFRSDKLRVDKGRLRPYAVAAHFSSVCRFRRTAFDGKPLRTFPGKALWVCRGLKSACKLSDCDVKLDRRIGGESHQESGLASAGCVKCRQAQQLDANAPRRVDRGALW